MIVVDASLAAKWLLWEADRDRAFAFLNRHGDAMAAPDILLHEVASAVVSRHNQRLMDRQEALTALDEWARSWRNELVQAHRVTADLAQHAGQLALQIGHPIADCIYLALAIELDCDLATCDAKFQARAGRHMTNVRLLDEFDLG